MNRNLQIPLCGCVLAMLMLTGCSSKPAEPSPQQVPPVLPAIMVAPEPSITKPAETAKPTEASAHVAVEPSSAAVEHALLLPPALPNFLEAGTKPLPFQSALDRGLPKTPMPTVAKRPTPWPSVKPVQPTTPQESLPRHMGSSESTVSPPAAPRGLLKAPSAANPGAADVPATVQQQDDRIALDDPTAAMVAQQLIHTALPLPTLTLPWLQQGLPDPFAYRQQLLPPMRPSEFALQPVPTKPDKK